MKNHRPRDKHYIAKVYHRRLRNHNFTIPFNTTIPHFTPLPIIVKIISETRYFEWNRLPSLYYTYTYANGCGGGGGNSYLRGKLLCKPSLPNGAVRFLYKKRNGTNVYERKVNGHWVVDKKKRY